MDPIDSVRISYLSRLEQLTSFLDYLSVIVRQFLWLVCILLFFAVRSIYADPWATVDKILELCKIEMS